MFNVFVSRDTESTQSYADVLGGLLEFPAVQPLIPHFAKLGMAVRLNALYVKELWTDLANGDASANRLFAITLGYILVGAALAIYLNVLSAVNVQTAGRAFRNAIRQQLIVLKVCTVIFILFCRANVSQNKGRNIHCS